MVSVDVIRTMILHITIDNNIMVTIYTILITQ